MHLLLELAGAPVPEDIQGVSLLPLLKGEKPADWRKSLYYHFYEYPAEHMVKRHYGVRTERYKLIHFIMILMCGNCMIYRQTLRKCIIFMVRKNMNRL